MTGEITVVIAARNAESTIGRAVRSVIDIDSKHVRDIIVVDDSSDDRTGHCANEAGARVLRLEDHAGRAFARNEAIKIAQSELIAILDADDVALSARFDETAKMFNEQPRLVAAGGQAIFISSHGNPWTLRHYPLADSQIREELARGSMALCHPATTFRRSAIEAVGGYRPEFTRAQDLDLARRLAGLGLFQNSNKPFVKYFHPVVLNRKYWAEARRFNLQVKRGAPVSLGVTDALRYPPAMLRRLWRYASSQGRA